MAFNSLLFFLFIIGVSLIYFIVPKRFQWVVLLVSSYFFYIYSAGKLVLILIITTLITFYTGVILNKINNNYKNKLSEYAKTLTREEKQKISKDGKRRKLTVLTISLIIVFGFLAFYKYFNFLSTNIISLFSNIIPDLQAPTLNLLLPLGISFYTFQSTGYIIDIYRGKIQPEKNLAKFALFVSFFPQIIQGPISRYSELARQLYESHDFDYARIKLGLQLILWGLFKKMVIADRISIAVNTIFSGYEQFTGLSVFIGAVFYSLQIYCDFSGGIDIAHGVAQIFGIQMPENFRRPFFATSISDFWRRWHITLSEWMRDYIFYPLSLSKAFGKIGRVSRKVFGNYAGKKIPSMLGMLITFTVVGVWHGSSWKFVAYGLYNAVFIMLDIFLYPLLTDFLNKHKFDLDTFSWRLYQMITTFFIVSVGRFFSRASSFKAAIRMIIRSFTTFKLSDFISINFNDFGLDNSQMFILVISLAILLIVELLQEKGVNVRISIAKQDFIFRWSLFLALIFAVIIFGVYGIGYNSNDFIYMGF